MRRYQTNFYHRQPALIPELRRGYAAINHRSEARTIPTTVNNVDRASRASLSQRREGGVRPPPAIRTFRWD